MRQGRAYLSAAMATREQSHRRALLLATGALILFSTSPVFGHHVAPRADELLLGKDHLLGLCLVALHVMLAPVHEVFHGLLVAGLVYAVWDRIRAWRSARRTFGTLDSAEPAPGDAFHAAAEQGGVPPSRVRVVPHLPNPAFTAGWFRPRVYVARELATCLTPAELAAVIAHEGAHVRRRDPLRLSLLRFLGCALFWLPALRRLADDLVDEAEVEADDVAARREPLSLASAILRLAEWRSAPSVTSGVVGFQRAPDLLERRVRRLAGEDVDAGSRVTRRSIASAAAALALVWVSGVVMAHPLPAATPEHPHGDHCVHHERTAVSHLFCLGQWRSSATAPCPHARAADVR